MATEVLLTQSDSLIVPVIRQLLVVWQDPASRRFIRVARLDELEDGRYAFRYLSEAHGANFSPLVQFPDVDAVYVSDSLPAFFSNRVMSRQRASYGDFREWLGLTVEGQDTPIEVLARTGGPRATDTFHIVDDLREIDGRRISRFFASGVGHTAGADERLAHMLAGHRLSMRTEPDNPANQRALLIDAEADAPVGWVPDWLVSEVHELLDSGYELNLVAERINPTAPVHLRLLCRLEARSSN